MFWDEQQAVARRQVALTGKLSARPAGNRGYLSPRRICDDPFVTTVPLFIQRALYAFSRHGGIYRSDVVQQNQILGRGRAASRWSAPPQAKERVGRTTLFSSSAMSSGRLFLDRVGRHQSPSPLHRHVQNQSIAGSKGTICHRTVSSVLTVVSPFGITAIWATNTNNKGRAPYRLAVQPDGNLVVYGASDEDVTLLELGVPGRLLVRRHLVHRIAGRDGALHSPDAG